MIGMNNNFNWKKDFQMAEYSISEQTGLFLTLFKNRSANMYNSANVLEGRIKKSNDFHGKQMNIETQLSFAGGYGAKLLPHVLQRQFH